MPDLTLLKKLIGIPSVSGDWNSIEEAMELVAGVCGGEKVFLAGKPALRAGRGEVLVLCHLDVVPGPKEVFQPRMESGRLWGRGAIDMKSQALAVAEAFAKHPDGITLYFTGDEETGGTQAAEIPRDFRAAFIPDGGPNFSFVMGQKGVGWLRCEVKGKPSHSSRPWEGRNAIEEGFRRHSEIVKAFDNSEGWHPTAVLSRVETSNPINAVPGKAWFWYDVRYTEDLPLEVFRRVYDSVEVKMRAEVFRTEFSWLHRLFSSEGRNLGLRFKRVFEHGASDARFFSGIPTVIFEPEGGGHHSDREWVSLSSLEKFQVLCERVFANLSGE